MWWGAKTHLQGRGIGGQSVEREVQVSGDVIQCQEAAGQVSDPQSAQIDVDLEPGGKRLDAADITPS
jgi:hypothetical protein